MRLIALMLTLAAALPPAAASPAQDEGPGAPPAHWVGLEAGESEGGVRVTVVRPGSPAERAGFRVGDWVLVVDGRPATDVRVVSALIDRAGPESGLVAHVLRDGRVLEITLPAAEGFRPRAPRVPAVRSLPARLGAKLEAIPAELRRHYGADPRFGVLVTGVDADGTGARAGLDVGDVLFEACGMRIVSPRQIVPCQDAGMTLRVIRAGKPVALTAAAGPPSEPPASAPADARELQIRLLEREMERLTRRLDQIRRSLAKLRASGDDGRE